jgi:hypothetical protein
MSGSTDPLADLPKVHCEDSAESGLALSDAVVCLRCLCPWIRLDDRLSFSLHYEIKGFVEIFEGGWDAGERLK